MDTGKGYFKQIEHDETEESQNLTPQQILENKMRALEDQFKNHGGWFRENEIIELRGSRFRVGIVKPNKIVLNLLPRNQS